MNSFINTLLAALAAAVVIHRLTGWLNALIVIPVIVVMVWLLIRTAGDGRRAMSICAEDSTDNHKATGGRND